MERETEMVRDYSCCSYSNGAFLYACTYRLSSGFDIFFDINISIDNIFIISVNFYV